MLYLQPLSPDHDHDDSFSYYETHRVCVYNSNNWYALTQNEVTKMVK